MSEKDNERLITSVIFSMLTSAIAIGTFALCIANTISIDKILKLIAG